MSRPAGSARRPSAGSTTIAARSRCLRADGAYRTGSAFRIGNTQRSDEGFDRAHIGVVGEELAVTGHLGQICFRRILRVDEIHPEETAARLRLSLLCVPPIPPPAA